MSGVVIGERNEREAARYREERRQQNIQQIEAVIQKAETREQLSELPTSLLQAYIGLIVPKNSGGGGVHDALVEAVWEKRQKRRLRETEDVKRAPSRPRSRSRSRPRQQAETEAPAYSKEDTYEYVTRHFNDDEEKKEKEEEEEEEEEEQDHKQTLPMPIARNMLPVPLQLSATSLASVLDFLPATEVDRFRTHNRVLFPTIDAAHTLLLRNCRLKLDCGLSAMKEITPLLERSARIVRATALQIMDDPERGRLSYGEARLIARNEMAYHAAERFPMTICQEQACQALVVYLSASTDIDVADDIVDDAVVGARLDVADAKHLSGSVSVNKNGVRLKIAGFTRTEWLKLLPYRFEYHVNHVTASNKLGDTVHLAAMVELVAKINTLLEEKFIVEKRRTATNRIAAEALIERLRAFRELIQGSLQNSSVRVLTSVEIGMAPSAIHSRQIHANDPLSVVLSFVFPFDRTSPMQLNFAMPFFTRFIGTLRLAYIWFRFDSGYADEDPRHPLPPIPTDAPPLPLESCDKAERLRLLKDVEFAIFGNDPVFARMFQNLDSFLANVRAYWASKQPSGTLSRFADQTWARAPLLS